MIPSAPTSNQNGIIIALASGDILRLDCFQYAEYPALFSKASLHVKQNKHPFFCWYRGKFNFFPCTGNNRGYIETREWQLQKLVGQCGAEFLADYHYMALHVARVHSLLWSPVMYNF